MKKIIVLIIALSMIATLAACGSSGRGQTATTGGSADGETFVFKHGFDLDYPPYSYINDKGDVGGFDVEMAQAVCEYYGWEYEAVPILIGEVNHII